MALVVMLPFDTVRRIIERAESNVPPDPEIADVLPALKKQTTRETPMISGHYQIALEPDRWGVLIGWCYMVRLHEDADLITGAVAIASALDE
jgi:hypothetical protein